MLLAFDTATPACTAALLSAEGEVLAERHEVMARGSAERLMPLLEAMLEGRRPDAIAVGCGPGSFTGLRVGIAAAHGLAIGWRVPLHGFSTLALLAVGQEPGEQLAVALLGGHGELFVQQFATAPFSETSDLLSLPPGEAARLIDAPLVVGSGAAALVEARGSGTARDALPCASHLSRLPSSMRGLAPRPIYVRAPDAKPKAAA